MSDEATTAGEDESSTSVNDEMNPEHGQNSLREKFRLTGDETIMKGETFHFYFLANVFDCRSYSRCSLPICY